MGLVNDKTCNDCGCELEWEGSIANGRMVCPAAWCKSNYERVTETLKHVGDFEQDITAKSSCEFHGD